MVLFSLHQEQELQQAMLEPQVWGPNPLLWLVPLPLVLVFLTAAGVSCVNTQKKTKGKPESKLQKKKKKKKKPKERENSTKEWKKVSILSPLIIALL